MIYERLTKREQDVFFKALCPDCKGPLTEGPSGGLSTNYYCAGLGESRFNYMSLRDVERISENRCPVLKTYEDRVKR